MRWPCVQLKQESLLKKKKVTGGFWVGCVALPISWKSDPRFKVSRFAALSISIFIRRSLHCFHWPETTRAQMRVQPFRHFTSLPICRCRGAANSLIRRRKKKYNFFFCFFLHFAHGKMCIENDCEWHTSCVSQGLSCWASFHFCGRRPPLSIVIDGHDPRLNLNTRDISTAFSRRWS